MKKLLLMPLSLSVVSFATLGCGSDEMSAADQAKLKSDFSKGGDASLLTENDKKRMAESMRNVGASRGTGATNRN